MSVKKGNMKTLNDYIKQGGVYFENSDWDSAIAAFSLAIDIPATQPQAVAYLKRAR